MRRMSTVRRPTPPAAVRWVLRAAGVLAVVAFAAAYAVMVTPRDSTVLVHRLAPVLLFVAAMSVVVGLADRAGVFDRIGAAAARMIRRRPWSLWPCVAGIAAVATAFLSLDTTAILVTPLVVALAARAGRPVVPFALMTVWIANIGSLFLPVSNLTNLLAVGRREGGFGDTASFVSAAGLPAAAALVVVLCFAAGLAAAPALRRRRDAAVGAPHSPAGPAAAPPSPASPVRHPMLVPCRVVLAVLLPLLASPVPYWASTTVAAAMLIAGFAGRDRAALCFSLVPWQAIGLAVGLMLVVRLLLSLGAGPAAAGWLGGADGTAGMFVWAGAGAIAANAVNNLPAYLLLEPAADSARRLTALLIGVNAGPVITPWASLATLLWADRLRRAGVAVPWRTFVLLGVPLALLAVGAATAVLAWAG